MYQVEKNVFINKETNEVIKIDLKSHVLKECEYILNLPDSDFYYKVASFSKLSFNLEDYMSKKDVISNLNFAEENNEELYELHIQLVKGETIDKILSKYNLKVKGIKNQVISFDLFIQYLSAILDLFFKVRDLNSKLFFHNDLNYDNIIYENDRFVLIDFGESTIIKPDCIEGESDEDAILIIIHSLFKVGLKNNEVIKLIKEFDIDNIEIKDIPLLYQKMNNFLNN